MNFKIKPGAIWPGMSKIFLVMKLIAIFLFVALTQVHASGYAQAITIHENRVSVEKVLLLIEKQSNYHFIYDSKLDVLKTKTISINADRASIVSILDKCLSDLPVTYTVIQQTIALKSKSDDLKNNNDESIAPQLFRITGKVTDENGGPLPGVSIRLKGTQTGTLTDTHGIFVLNVPDSKASLEFSFIGYDTQTVEINDQAEINISLKPVVSKLNEVIVVGYGIQKKVNLTGAVSSVSGDDLKMKPAGQSSAALQGAAPGVTVTQSSGRPGGDGGTIRIRGVGTLGDAGPLTLIDGVEGSIDNIDPNMIESVSILKDAASASIYGSRAANGVLLVTTRRAGNKMNVNYSNYLGWQKATNMPDNVDALDHMLLLNQAYTNVGRAPLYSDALLQAYRAQNGVSSDQYPNTDWAKATLTGSGFQESHFVTVNGGTEKVRTLASVGFFDQKGIINNSSFRRYTIRNNADFTISPKLSMKFDLQFVDAITKEPGVGSGNIFNFIDGIPANQIGINSNGTWGVGWNGMNPIAATKDGGVNSTNGPFGTVNAVVNYHPVDWLRIDLTEAPKYAESNTNNFNEAIQTYLPDGTLSYKTPSLSTLFVGNSRSFYNTLRGTLTAEKAFGSHNLKLLAGVSQETYRNDNFNASRDTYVLPDYPVISAGSAANQQTGGSAEAWALRSYFGRINYDYKQKYLLEINGRYDGSSRFTDQHKYGFFPSASAGWRISEEDFMKPLKKVIDELKLRGSWGRLGNQNIGTYPSVTAVALGTGVLGKQIVNVAALNALANGDITWETTEMSDIGLDMTLFSNLTISGDVYYRKTSGILEYLNIPLILGLSAPAQNAGVMTNKGWELNVNYKGHINAFRYGINFNLSDVVNKVIDLRGVNQTGLTVAREGYSYNSLYGFQAEGFFKDAADIAGHATQFGTLAPGDIKYKDQNGDGIINDKDKVILGSTIPRYTFSTTLNGSYKGFDFNIFLQGVGKANGYLYGPGLQPFTVGNLGGTILEEFKDSWTPQNPNAKYPRLAFGESNNTQVSSFWAKNAAYLRVKNVQIGYTIPAAWSSRIGLKSLRVFANGSNLFTSDSFWKGFDVESPVGTVNVYPQVKVYTFGLNVNF